MSHANDICIFHQRHPHRSDQSFLIHWIQCACYHTPVYSKHLSSVPALSTWSPSYWPLSHDDDHVWRQRISVILPLDHDWMSRHHPMGDGTIDLLHSYPHRPHTRRVPLPSVPHPMPDAMPYAYHNHLDWRLGTIPFQLRHVVTTMIYWWYFSVSWLWWNSTTFALHPNPRRLPL